MAEPKRVTRRYAASLKSAASDELLNTYLIRPLAWVLVRPLLRTRLRPEAIVGLNTALAAAAAVLFLRGTESANAYAGLLLIAKILFDAVDGQLARAKGLVTRLGRFLDSLSDFYTNLLIFLAIGAAATRQTADPTQLFAWLLCFWVMTLQCSYFNYYLVAELTAMGRGTASRLDEGFKPADEGQPRHLRWLQRLYLWTYGWQDRFIAWLDDRSGAGSLDRAARQAWYSDATALRLSSFLGMGTLLTPLALLALVDRMEIYLLFMFGVCNAIFASSLAYRRALARRLAGGG